MSASLAMSTSSDNTIVIEFRAVDAAPPPATDLIEAMVEDMVPLYGRIDAPDAPSASPADFSPPGGVFLVGYDDAGGRSAAAA